MTDCLTDIFVLIHVCCQTASFVSAVEISRPPLLSSASVPGWSPHFWAAQLEQQPGLEPKWKRCFRPRAKQVYCRETLLGCTLISGLGAGEEEEGEASKERWGREVGEKRVEKKFGCNQKTEEDKENDEPQTNLHFYITYLAIHNF